MANPRPEGHPGEDAGLKLALTRLLASTGVATKAQIDAALASEKGARTLYSSGLVAAGVSSVKLLPLLARASGLPAASSAWVRKPMGTMARELDVETCRALLAVPFRRENGQLHVAFAAPLPPELAASLPPHVPHVALEDDVRAGLDSLFRGLVPVRPPAASPPSAPVAPVAPVAAPAPDDGTADTLLKQGLEGLGAPPGVHVPTNYVPPMAMGEAGSMPLPPLEALPPLPELGLPPPAKATDLAAAGAPIPPRPSRPRPQLASGPHTAPEIPGEVVVTQRELLVAQLKRLVVPVAGVLALVVVVKGVGCLIDSSRREVDDKGTKLAQGMGLKPPTPANGAGPVDVEGAVVAVDAAARAGEKPFFEACRALAEQLRAEATSAGRLAQQRAELRNVSVEVAQVCDQGASQPQAAWAPVRAKVMQALTGNTSDDGPKYQVAFPPEYAPAKADFDASIRANDIEAACNKLRRVHDVVVAWVPKMPGGARALRLNEVAQEMERTLVSCANSTTVNAMRVQWIRWQQRLEPGAE